MASSTAKRSKNPFAPGTGTLPEHVVGRQSGFELLEEALYSIEPSEIQKDGRLERTSIAPIVLTGPCGAGKTLMLDRMQQQAQEMGIHVARLAHAKDLSPGDAMKNLLHEMAGDADDELLRLLQSSKFAAVGTDKGMSWRDVARMYEYALKTRLRQGPLVLMMDDAHRYQLDIMGFMLGFAHNRITRRHPLVMLLAGSPDLRSYMTNLGTGFYATSEDIYINLLATEESKDALSKPFTDRGIEVEPEALEMMWGMTDNYPFFVQLVGSEIWKSLSQDGNRRVDAALVEQSQAGVIHKRSDFYSLLYEEMSAEELTSYALQAAETINRQEEAKAERGAIENDLRRKNKDLDAKKARRIVDRLQWLGFIWEGDEDQMEAGIPSFFTYLQEMC